MVCKRTALCFLHDSVSLHFQLESLLLYCCRIRLRNTVVCHFFRLCPVFICRWFCCLAFAGTNYCRSEKGEKYVMYVFHVQKFLVESWRAATVLSIFPGLKALWLSACEPASLLAHYFFFFSGNQYSYSTPSFFRKGFTASLCKATRGIPIAYGPISYGEYW